MINEIKPGNVVKLITGQKIVVTKGNIEDIIFAKECYIFVCEKPHQDGDFSYLCQSEYCRCSD